MNCKHCKAKDAKIRRVQPNGNLQYQCKKCKKYFTIEQEKKVEEKLWDGVGTRHKCSFNVLSKYGDGETARRIASSAPEGMMYTELCIKDKDGDNRHEVITISEFDILTLDHFNETRGLKEEIKDLESRLDHADKVNLANVKFMQDIRTDNHKLSMKVQYRNVAICLLVAGLAIVSGMLFY